MVLTTLTSREDWWFLWWVWFMSTTNRRTSHHQAKLSLTQSTQTPPATWDEGEQNWRWGDDYDFENFGFWIKARFRTWWAMGINTWGKCYPVVRIAHPRDGPARQLTIQRRLFKNFWLYATELHWVVKYIFLIKCWGPWFISCSTVSSLITW